MTRIPSIDGLRGIAALLVVVFHSFPLWFAAHVHGQLAPGFVGVRLFFVLSGALISGLLWSLHEGSIGATWRRFAYRRALRIFPLAYVTLALCWIVSVPAMVEQPWAHLTFTNNWAQMPDPNWPSSLPHWWTLALEEQIYLVWPVLLLAVPFRRWPVVAVALINLALWRRVLLPWPWLDPLFYLDAFAAGSLIAWSARAGHLRDMSRTALVIGTGVAVLWFQRDIIFETGLALISAGVVGWTWQRPNHRALSWRPLVWLGSISYGVYVWHEAGPRILYQIGLPYLAQGWDVLALKAGLGIGLAALTWYGFERPINRLKNKTGALIRTPVNQRTQGTRSTQGTRVINERDHPSTSRATAP